MQAKTVKTPVNATPKKTPAVVSPPVPPKIPYKIDRVTPKILKIAM